MGRGFCVAFWLGVFLCTVAASACGDPEAPDAITALEGRLIEVGSEAPVLGRVTGFPELGSVATSSPAGSFRLEGARFGVRYRLVGSAQGYLDSEVTVVPRFAQPTSVEIALQPAVACLAGRRRCARGGAEGVETCTPDGRGFSLEPCSADEICDPAATACVQAPTLRLTVDGSGSVVSSPSGILCNPSCERSFPRGTEIVLEARPFGDGGFEGWGGACSGTEPRCVLRLDGDLQVQASFRTTAYRLTVDTRGGGRVSSMPEGIDCGSDCEALFSTDTDVTLMAQPDAGREFQTWERDCSGTTPSCTVRLDRARQVRARFRTPGPVLSLTLEGPGAGRVTSSPSGIDCGDDCSSGFPSGTEVVLTAEAAVGSRFSGWGGACSGVEPTCTVAMTQARSVTARFEGDTVQVTVTRPGGGRGRVTSTPAGIDCGTSCAAPFSRGLPLSLEANPDAAAVFAGWMGACAPAGLTASCELTPSADVQVEARFEPFFLGPLPADAACRYGLDFEAPTPLSPGCGASGDAIAPGWTAGPSRSALLGDALGPPPDGAPLDIGRAGPAAAPATVELSVRRDGGASTLFSDQDRADPARAGWSIRLLADGRIAASTYDGMGGATTATTAAAALPPSSWAHVAVVVEAGGLAVFVDGAEAARVVEPLRLAGSSSTAWVGGTRTGTSAADRLRGAVDGLRISDAARYP